RIVCMTSGAFYKPVTSNTIFVAQNSPAKRKDLDQQAVQTFYLTNMATDKDANDILTALRNLMDPTTKMTLVASQNAIVMRASPDQLLLAEKLIHDLDRTRPEVVVDVAILEVNRDKIRKLGISLPTSFSLTPQASNANSTTSSGGSGSTTTTTSGLTLNSLSKLNATNFAVGISSGTLDAMLSDTDTKVLQNPRLRATDGQKATLKIGQKYPYATGSYGGYGGVGVGAGVGGYGGIGVQTQFQFADIGVNIEMTPTVHADRQITLKMKVEDSTHAGDVTIQQQTEPIFGQRQVEQVIQLMDGEPNILAGIVIQQDNLSVSGTPGLGELPFFKYLFSSQQREKAQDEIVFLLIPHIVRETTLTRLNTRAIDTGTSTAVEIRREASATTPDDLKPINPPKPQPVGQPTSAANAANAAVQEMKKQAAPPTPPPPAATPAPVTAPGTQPQTPPAPRLNRMTPPPSAQPPAQTQPAAPASTSAANAAKAAAPPAAPRASVAPVSTTAPGSQTQVASAAPSPALPAETVPPVAPAQPSGPTPPVSFSVVPPAGNQAVGSTFKVDVNLSNGKDIDSVPIQLQFDPKVLQLVNVDAGSFMGRDGQAVSAVHRDDGNGLATIVVARPPNTTGVSGQGSVATLTFKAVAAGDSNLNLVKVGAINSSQTNIPAVGAQSVVHVK
ncbi:MAG: cohesin domain-containing protein, partial [Acidobacteriaceae bacterium]|nr:cohesin domain-containing protein [Acidobacteriaceae bacterium]